MSSVHRTETHARQTRPRPFRFPRQQVSRQTQDPSSRDTGTPPVSEIASVTGTLAPAMIFQANSTLESSTTKTFAPESDSTVTTPNPIPAPT